MHLSPWGEVGTPPTVSIRAPQPIGVPGELYIGGAAVSRGYLGNPAESAARFVPDPFGEGRGARLYRTGDRARYRPASALERQPE